MLPCLYKKSPLFCSLCSVQLLPRPEMESVSPNTGYICRSAHYIPGKVAPACQKDTAFPVFLSRTSSSSCRYLSIPDAACQEYLYTQPLSVLLCLHPIPGTGILSPHLNHSLLPHFHSQGSLLFLPHCLPGQVDSLFV